MNYDVSGMSQLVSIIIVNWNGKKWLKTCFDSLLAQTYPHTEIILVDNASSDDSVSYTEALYPSIRVIKNTQNDGFGVANMMGVAESHGELLFFVNTDTESGPDLLQQLVQWKQARQYHLVGPRVVTPAGADLLQGKYLGIDVLGYPGPSEKLFYIEGCALLIARADFLRLGGFDRTYFMYSEDIDLSWRAHLYGLSLGICEEARLIHVGGGSSVSTNYDNKGTHTVPRLRRYEVEKNTLRNLLKNVTAGQLLWRLPLFLVQDFCECLLYICTGNFAMVSRVFRAIIWNIIHINDTYRCRQIIQRERTVGDRTIFCRMNRTLFKVQAFWAMGLPTFK